MENNGDARLRAGLSALCAPMSGLAEFAVLAEDIRGARGPFAVHELGESQKAHFAAALGRAAGLRVIYIAHNEYAAQKAYEDFSALLGGDALFYPAREIMLYDVEAKNYDIVFRRVKALDRLLAGDFRAAVMSAEAAAQFVPPPGLFAEMTLRFEPGGRLDTEDISARLVGMGYERAPTVEARGTFAIRGGILDVYPIDSEYAARVELFDDEIDSVRLFDAATQRTVETAEGGVRCLPARDILYREDALDGIIAKIEHAAAGGSADAASEAISVAVDIEKFRTARYFAGIDRYLAFLCEGGHTVLSYVGGKSAAAADGPSTEDGCVYILDEPARAFQKLASVEEEQAAVCASLTARGKLLPGVRLQRDFHELVEMIPARRRVALSQIRSAREAELLGPQKSSVVAGRSAVSYQGNVALLIADIRERLREKWTVILLTKSAVKSERLAESLRAEDIPVRRLGFGNDTGGTVADTGAGASPAIVRASPAVVRDAPAIVRASPAIVRASPAVVRDAPAIAGAVNICYGALTAGFEYPKIKLIVICDTEFQGGTRGARAARRAKKAGPGAKINFFTDLRAGDYVVHQTHGIGVFAGLEQLTVDGAKRDFLKIRYKDGDVLYIPTNQLDLVQKYVGSDARAPKVNSLNSGEWSKTKKRVKESLRTLAAELILIYAKRREAQGFAYSPDTVWQRQFEEQFPYSETDDQLRSIEEIKADMESPRLMDRLLCGDVGFGKTEVAVRAAFKAVSDGKQVAFLVPTTVLAQQHYKTFSDRFGEFPVTVDVLSRFRTAKEQSKIKENLRLGKIDIIVGTHKLLNKAIGFKNLGLLVVDEEQRFGVNQKERIKTLKPDVDVLSLSATPIPRTLHMSMTKIRDISVLDDPPEERFPVQTFVMEYDEDVVREAILREAARGGQVFYLYNRVMGIDIKAMQVRQMLPEGVRVAYAHGQMSDRELEDVMLAFVNRQYDVLICTTIIESGLDMPNVNTIIVEDADRMGLAQLYQLRGRVGRSNRLAYAYITHRRDKVVSEESEKRLQAIREFTELGSGFKIAMRDMEIRGIGNLLGVEQHGHMESVGYDMYCRLLDEAVREIEREQGITHTDKRPGSGTRATGEQAPANILSADAAKRPKSPAGITPTKVLGVGVAPTKVPGVGAAPTKVLGVGVASTKSPIADVSSGAGKSADVSSAAGSGADVESQDPVAAVNLDIHINAYIDSRYIEDEAQRLEMYQKIAAVRGEDDARDITDELIDRYSSLPPETENLIKLALVKVLAAACGIASVADKEGRVTMYVAKRGPFSMERLSAVSQRHKGRVLFNAGGAGAAAAPYIVYKPAAVPARPHVAPAPQRTSLSRPMPGAKAAAATVGRAPAASSTVADTIRSAAARHGVDATAAGPAAASRPAANNPGRHPAVDTLDAILRFLREMGGRA